MFEIASNFIGDVLDEETPISPETTIAGWKADASQVLYFLIGDVLDEETPISPETTIAGWKADASQFFFFLADVQVLDVFGHCDGG